MANSPLADANRRSVRQLICYGLVGIVSNLAGYVAYVLFTYLGATPKITMTFLYGIGVAVSFWGNRTFTFAHKGHLLRVGVRYVLAHCCGYSINFLILTVLVDQLGYPHQWVQAAAIIVVASILFLMFKFFVFRM